MARTGPTPRKRPTRWTPKKGQRFLDLLSQGFSVSHAARKSGFVRQTLYERRDEDEDFAKAWDDALEVGTDVLEDEARRRASVGTLRPVYYQGAEVGKIREYSDTLLIFLMKARRPEKYRDQLALQGIFQHRHRGSIRAKVEKPVDDPDRIAGIISVLAGLGAIAPASPAPRSGSSNDTPPDPIHPARPNA